MRFVAGVVAAALAIPGIAAAKIIELAFTPDARFEHAESISPGRFLEVCGKLEQGQRVEWTFHAAAPVDFNIHYHVAEKVEFPEKRAAVVSLEGSFVAPVSQHFCWMWKNNGQADVKVKTTFRKP